MQKLRILVVDDNREFRQNLADILEMKGFEVVSAPDGFKAVEIIKQNGIDVVLMDVRMPGMDGVQTFKKIKEVAPSTPVIMVTAYAVKGLIREALRSGAYGSLKKPLDFDLLFEVIERALPDGELILVVDDDEKLCANMKDVLSAKGYRVSVAYDGGAALEKAKNNNFDVMLIDMKLPTLNGLETYLAIRDFRPKAVVIIITGYRQEMGNLVEQALSKSAYTMLEKPVDMDELVSLLQKIRQQKDKGAISKPD